MKKVKMKTQQITKKKILLYLMLSVFISALSLNVAAQQSTVKLCDPDYEFSGLAKWRDKILLIPQHRKMSDSYNIVVLDSSDINITELRFCKEGNENSIKKHGELQLHQTFINAIETIIKDDLKSNSAYGGFEAATTIKDTIFLSIETDSPFCYIVKGYIDGNYIRYTSKLKIYKPEDCYYNASFESLVFLEKEKQLLAIYEKNRDTAKASAFLIDASLQGQIVPVKFNKPLYFRITDAALLSTGEIIVINHHYSDCHEYCEEFNYYVGGENREKASEEMYYTNHKDSVVFKDSKENSFTRLIKLKLQDNILTWSKNDVIPVRKNEWGYNWEGILPFKNGVLMIVDAYPPGNIAGKFQYFEFKNK